MMKSKVLKMLLALSLVLLVATACGGAEDDNGVRNLSTEEQKLLTDDVSHEGVASPDTFGKDAAGADGAEDAEDVEQAGPTSEDTFAQPEPNSGAAVDDSDSDSGATPEEKDPLNDISDGVDWDVEGPGGGDLEYHELQGWDLPALEDVSVEDTPLLYDFLNSCLDWHVSIHRDTTYSEIYIMRNLNYPNIAHTDYYVIQGDINLPPAGSKIWTMELTASQVNALEEIVPKMPEERVIREGDWQLICLERNSSDGLTGFGPDGTWATFTPRHFGVIYNYTQGNPRPFLESGEGWPTEWLRREPYASGLIDMGLNMSKGWWDEFRYQGKYRMEPMSVATDTEYAGTLTCTGYEKFNYDRDDGFSSQNVDWSNIVRMCDSDCYEVIGKYTPVLGSTND